MNIFGTLLSLLPSCGDDTKWLVGLKMLPKIVPVYDSDDSDGTPSPEKKLRREDLHRSGPTNSFHAPSPPLSPGEVLSPVPDEEKNSSDVEPDHLTQGEDVHCSSPRRCNRCGDSELHGKAVGDEIVQDGVCGTAEAMDSAIAGVVQHESQKGEGTNNMAFTLSPIARKKKQNGLISVSRKPVGFKVLPFRNPVGKSVRSPTPDLGSQSPVLTTDLRDNLEVNDVEPSAIIRNEESAADRPICETEFVSLTRDEFVDSDFQKPLPRLFFFFLTSQNVKELRAVARIFRVKQDSPKIGMMCGIFLAFMRRLHKGIPRLSLMLSDRVLRSFQNFSGEAKSELKDEEIPSVDYIKTLSTAPCIPAELHPAFSIVKLRAKHLAKVKESSLTTSAVASDRSNHGRNMGRGSGCSTDRRIARHAVKRRATEVHAETVDITALTPANLELETPPTSPVGKEDELDEESAAVTDNEGHKHLSLSEFGRLLLIMRDDEKCRKAFLDSQQPLSRLQLDRGDRPGDYWVTAIDPVYNEAGSTNYIDCSSVLLDIDTSRLPQQYRSGKELKNWFTGFRPKFRNYLTK